MKILVNEIDTYRVCEDEIMQLKGSFEDLSKAVKSVFFMGYPRYKIALDNQMILQGLNPNTHYITLVSGFEVVSSENEHFCVRRRFSPADAGDEFKINGVRPCGDPAANYSWHVLALLDTQPPTQFPAFVNDAIRRFAPGQSSEVTDYEAT